MIGKIVQNWMNVFWFRIFVNSNKTYCAFDIIYVYSGARRVLKENWGSLFDLEYWGWHRNFNYPFSALPPLYIDPRPVYIDQRRLFVGIFRSPDFAKDSYPLNTISSWLSSLWWWSVGKDFAGAIGGLGQIYIQDKFKFTFWPQVIFCGNQHGLKRWFELRKTLYKYCWTMRGG